ncbi:MAG: heavy metal translocating P-type ATPase [Patescibacteria group bacterium]
MANHNHQHQHQHNHQTEGKTVYICPMCPGVESDRPGQCPACGMHLIKSQKPKAKSQKEMQKKHQNHNKHAGHSAGMFLKKFWLSLILTIPVILYSDIFQKVVGLRLPDLEIGNWEFGTLIPAILGSVVFFYGGAVFLKSAWQELKARLPGMMSLIALAISAAYLWSIYAVFFAPAQVLFWELTTLITIMLLGHWFEMRAVSGVQGALKELSKLLPDKAERVKSKSGDQEQIEVVGLDELMIGDVLLVRPGAKIPADAKVISGSSEVNESMITGESKPILKTQGSEVIAGTVNGDGSLKIQVIKLGEKTFLSGVMRLVAEAQASKSRLQILSDKAAFYLTLIAIGAGIITFFAWILARAGVSFAMERLVSVLVIACPHALGLAVPLAASISTTLAAHHGFLVRQRLALESARNVDLVLFDKTGTLTLGQYGVSEIIRFKDSISENDLLQLASSVDFYSEHFVARAIVKQAQEKNLELSEVKNFQRIPGKGVKGEVNNKTVFVGGEAILNHQFEIPERVKKLAEQGKTIVYLMVNNEIWGAIALADLIREESFGAIKQLKKMGIKTAMLTGDNSDVAEWVANQLGIDEYFANVLPGEKAAKVKALQAKGNKVAMVGDGINDAPALTQADLGIAVGAGTNVAIESAGIILVKNDPRDIAKVIQLSRLTHKKMIQNLFWAAGYNIFALPLAAGALAFKGIMLQPALAALLMSLSTVIVAFNALLMKKQFN